MEKRLWSQYGARTVPARNFRRGQTVAEKRLWFCLRDRKLAGFKFRRQFPIGPFFADFCCVEEKLCIEVDGPVHQTTADQDANRTVYLIEQGFRVLRFSNRDVVQNIYHVLAQITSALQNASTCPLPVGEGGRRRRPGEA